jgi:hypothetical protein
MVMTGGTEWPTDERHADDHDWRSATISWSASTCVSWCCFIRITTRFSTGDRTRDANRILIDLSAGRRRTRAAHPPDEEVPWSTLPGAVPR